MPRLLQFKTFPAGIERQEESCLKTQVESLKSAVSDFLEDGAVRLAAALSYYTVLSFAPLLLIVVGIAGYVGEHEAIARHLIEQITTLVGPAGGELARSVLMSANAPSKGFIAIVTGMVTLLIGTTGVFGQLQEALNIIWDVEGKPGGWVWSLIRSRLLSFAMVLAIGLMLLVSLVLSAAITLLQNQFASSIGSGWLWQVINTAASLVVMTILFGLMFKLLPDAYIAWRDVAFGSVVTGLLVTLGKFAIGLYLGRSSVGSTYGAAGSLAVLLVWIYYSALIVLFGAELTQAYARRRGTAIAPKPHAKRREC